MACPVSAATLIWTLLVSLQTLSINSSENETGCASWMGCRFIIMFSSCFFDTFLMGKKFFIHRDIQKFSFKIYDDSFIRILSRIAIELVRCTNINHRILSRVKIEANTFTAMFTKCKFKFQNHFQCVIFMKIVFKSRQANAHRLNWGRKFNERNIW